MNIHLIDPEGVSKGLNIGLGMLAASLKRAGYSVRVVDFNNDSRNIAARLSRIPRTDVVGVSVKSFTAPSACAIAGLLGRRDLICGGPHIAVDGLDFLKCNTAFSVGIIGEAEDRIPDLISAITDGRSLDRIPGVLYRDCNDAVVASRDRNVCPPQDLDLLADPDYSCFDSVGSRIQEYPVITSRGCPYSCIYCCVGEISGRRMRFRSIGRVVDEIERAKKDCGSLAFSVLDDNFTFDVNRAKDFCRLLLERKVSMEWSCPNGLRADRIDGELARLMAESGCRYASVGIESMEVSVFDAIDKGESLRDVENAVRLLSGNGIRVNGFMLIGLPGDSFSKSMASLKACSRLGLSSAHWNMLVPYPGTRAWEWVREHGRILGDWRSGFHFGPSMRPTFETDEFPGKEMIRAYRIANIRSHNYSAFFDRNSGLLANVLRIVFMIIRYDSANLLGHFFYAAGRLKSVIRVLSRI